MVEVATSQPPEHVLAIPRARLRTCQPIDVVVFGSACPACGDEATWVEERDDTRMHVSIDCPRCPTVPSPSEP